MIEAGRHRFTFDSPPPQPGQPHPADLELVSSGLAEHNAVESGEGTDKSEKTTRNVKLWARQWLENFYRNVDSKSTAGVFAVNEEIEETIGNIVGVHRLEAFGKSFRDYGDAVYAFYYELVKFTESKIREGGDAEALKSFLDGSRNMLFNGASAIEDMPLDRLLILAARTSRYEQTEGWFAADSNELVYKFAYGFNGERLLEEVSQQSVPEILDIIHKLVAVANYAEPEDQAGQATIRRIKDFILAIGKKNGSAFVGIASRLSLPKVEKLATGEFEETAGDTAVEESVTKVSADYFGFPGYNNLLMQFGKTNKPEDRKSIWHIAEDQNLDPYGSNVGQDMPLLLQQLHRQEFREAVEQDLNIELAEIPLASQIHLLRLLADPNRQNYNRLKSILSDNPAYKLEFLKTFLVVSEDLDYGKALLDVAELCRTKPELGTEIFAAYNNHTERLKTSAEQIQSESISREIITQALLSRGKDFIVELHDQLVSGQTDPEASVKKFIAELENESAQEKAHRTLFKNIATVLGKKDINLSTFQDQQQTILNRLLEPGNKALFLQVLSRLGKISPIPEIHWRVDRTSEEYDRRFGFNLDAFLAERAAGIGKKQILLEIGPGSGVAKKARTQSGLAEHYQDFALSDRIYYPLAPVIEKLIDFEKLESSTGQKLSKQDRKQLAEFIYRTLVIAPGETSSDQFSYDEQVRQLLGVDINALKGLLPDLPEKLAAAKEVPNTISARDGQGQVIYPYKIKADEQSPAWQKAKQKLEATVTEFLQPEWQEKDYYELIDAFPANVMLADLQDIDRLKPNQIDVEIGARSTVYARGEDYITFLQKLERTLSDGGVAIDDSIRDNDGWYYRIAEVLEAKEKIKEDLEILVVLGRPFSGEDYLQGEADKVPLAMIITKQGTSRGLVENNLKSGCQLVTLESLAENSQYLKTLDSTGWTEARVRKTVQPIELAA